MATHYITSTANTGTGTLRTLILNATSGDTIQPDPTIFPEGTVCKVTLASNLDNTLKNLTIIGSQTRLEINGENAYYFRLGASGSVPLVFRDVDFVNLYSVSTNVMEGPLVFRAPNSITVTRCRAVGCTGYYAGGFKVYGSTATAKFYDCAAYGNRCTATSGQVAYAFWFNTANANNEMYRCTYGGCVTQTTGTAGAFKNTPTKIGDYVAPTYQSEWKTPPSSTYAYSTWTKDSWKEMDPRPTSTSSFRTGSSTSSSDILDLNGRARKTNGAKGAFEYFALASPEIVTATERDSDGFKISWSAVENATGYRVTVVSQGETPYTETIETSQYSWVFTGLEPLTTYDVSVVAFCERTDPYYDDSEPTTIEATTATDALGRLSWPIFRGTGVYSDYIWVEWNVPERAAFIRVTVYEGAASEANVLYRNTFKAYDEDNEASVVNDISFYPPASGTYVVGFKAFPSVADSATYLPSLENTASFEYEAPTLITLDTPTNLAASNITDTSATLSWNAVANASGYVVEWRASGASSWNSETVN